MADEQPVIDPIDPLVDPPLRTEAPADFTPKADRFLAALPAMVRQFNAAIAKMNSLATWVMNVAKAAAASATASDASAKASATSAQQSSGFADASKGSADAANNTLTSVRVVAQAVDASAGLPPNNVPGGVLRQKLDGSGQKEWWQIVVSQVGDVLASTQGPDANWLLMGRAYSKAAYPALFAKLGQVADWADNQINLQYLNSQDVYGCTAFGSGVFVVLRSNNGSGGSWSSDTVTWTDFTFPAIGACYFTSMVYGNGLFVGIQYNGSSNFGQYVTSPDGKNWTVRNLPSQPNGSYWYDLQWNGSVFIIASASTNESLVSSDGINWTKRTLPAIQLQQSAVTTGNRLAMYWNPSSSTYYTSSDGITWAARTFPFVGYVAWSSGNGKVAFVSGSTLYVTNDSITWSQYPIPSFPQASNVTLFLVNESGYVIGFQSATAQPINDYYTSVDGRKWVSRKATSLSTFPNTLDYRKPAYGNKTFIVRLAATSSQVLRLRPYNYDTVNQFFITDIPNPVTGVDSYIKAL